jgi:ABC-2 type transport system permease protein
MSRTLAIIPHLVRMYVRTRLEYRGDMILGWLSQIASYASAYTVIALLIIRFDSLGGWRWSEMALLLSFHLFAYSLGASLSFTQFRDMEEKVRLGTFDAILVKPVNIWAYLVFSGINIGYTGHFILAIGLMAWAATAVDVAWSLPTILLYVGGLLSAAMSTAAILTMIGATALIWVRSNHLYSIYFGFWELARYPLNIFPGPLQLVMVTVVPLGYLAYVPVAVILDKPVPILGEWAGLASLAVGPLCALGGALLWRHCLRNYQGAGG